MPVKVLMPALSPTMTSGNLVKWIKKEGDKVKAGVVLAEIETDKATMEMEAIDEGTLAKVLVPEGTENVSVNSLIAIILEEGEGPEVIDSIIASHTLIDIAAPMETKSVAATTVIPDTTAHNSKESRIFASPLAKKIAEQKNINLNNVVGSGPHGRIVKSDIISYSPSSANIHTRNADEFSTKKHTNVGKIIAKRLLESKQTIPHFYLNIECRLDKLLDIRSEMNAVAQEKYKLSVNDFIIKAVGLAMRDLPDVNVSWDDNHILTYNNVDISIAVASDSGLITPVLRNVDFKSMPELSNEMKVLVQKARDNKLRPEEFQGGGFTISNLGMYGIKSFSAIINPPQSCILAVGEGAKRAIVENNEVKIATMMDVTLSCDHRVVDGALGALFLKRFKEYIERPVLMLIK